MTRIRPRVGISACLLGQKVRYNGESKLNNWLVDRLGKFVTWVPFCPEMEMGLGAPRRPMRLEGLPSDPFPRLIVDGTNEDLGALARKTSKRMLAEGDELDLDSYIFKRDSPSCGLERVKIYGNGKGKGKDDIPIRSATGIFAAEVKKKFPSIILIEEGRLNDQKQREQYLIRLFAFARFRKLQEKVSELQKFHQHYKLLLMAHDPKSYQALGKLAANYGELKSELKSGRLLKEYQAILLAALGKNATRGKWVNVFQHMLGYFKDKLDSRDRKHLLEIFEEYRRGEIPWSAPIELINHLVKKYSIKYLETQALFNLYPKTIMAADE